METAQAIFAKVERGRATGSYVTRNHLTGSDVSHVTDHNRSSSARKGNGSMFSPRFFLTSVAVQIPWLPKFTRTGGRVCACPEVRVSRAFFLSTEGWG